MHDDPIDPFAGEPNPADRLDMPEPAEPLSLQDRQEIMEDLADLEIYQTLLDPVGIRGLVIECEDCHKPHYLDWDLLRGNLRHLADSGQVRAHEPAFDPDPDHYVTWDYARGYADGVHDTLADGGDGDGDGVHDTLADGGDGDGDGDTAGGKGTDS